MSILIAYVCTGTLPSCPDEELDVARDENDFRGTFSGIFSSNSGTLADEARETGLRGAAVLLAEVEIDLSEPLTPRLALLLLSLIGADEVDALLILASASAAAFEFQGDVLTPCVPLDDAMLPQKSYAGKQK